MDTHDYLSLQPVHLNPNETWKNFSPSLTLVLVKSGFVKFISGTTAQRLGAGDVFVVNSAIDGALSTGDQETVSLFQFSAGIEHLYPLFSGGEIALAQQIVDIFKRPHLFSSGKPIAAECQRLALESGSKSGLDQRSLLLRIVAVVLSDEFKSAQYKRTSSMGAEDHVIQVFEKLAVTDLLSLSVDEIAAKFNCSRRHLNRLFHHYFGYSVGALKMEIRLLKAVSLLRDSSSKVINVAEEAGFNHLGLFNTCFKRRFGVSPGEWRKMTALANKPASANGFQGACQQLATGMCPLMVTSNSNSCEHVIRNLQTVHAQRPNQPPTLEELESE